jgi:hypothetical protein
VRLAEKRLMKINGDRGRNRGFDSPCARANERRAFGGSSAMPAARGRARGPARALRSR